DDIGPNLLLEITEPETKPAAQAPPSEPRPAPLFEDVSAKLSHRHLENVFDDFARQPLLPNRLSQLGPALAWQDIDGDGWEDLVIGSGRGGTVAFLRNDTKGGFTPVSCPGLDQPEKRDTGGILGLQLGENAARLLLVRQSYEDDAS